MTPVVRRARRAVTLVFFLNGLLFGAWATRIPAIQDRLELGEARLGLALAFIAIGALCSMPLSGWLSARGGSRRTTRGYLVLFCVVVVLIGLSPSYLLFVGFAFLYGFASGGLDVAMNAHGVAVEHRSDRPILSSMHAAFSFGGLVGGASGAALAGAAVDAELHLGVGGIAGLVVALVITRGLLPGDVDARGGRGGAEAEAYEPGPMFVLPPRSVWALGVVAFAGLVAEGATGDWSGVYVDDDLGASPGVAGLSFTAFSLTMTIGRLYGDRLASAWGSVALVRRGGLLSAVGLGIALVLAHPAAAVVGFACLGFGLAAVVPVVFREAGNVEGVPAGIGLAAVSTMGYTGFLIGPPLIGAVAELTSLPIALGLVAGLGLVLAGLAGHVHPERVAAAGGTTAPVVAR